MASIHIQSGKIGNVRGYARHVVFAEGLGVCREFPGEKEILPQALPLAEYLAMQYFQPPLEAVQSYGSIQGHLNSMEVVFGTGNRSGHDYEWVPTSARWEDCRAWVLRDRFTEGGGEGWIGNPIYHNNAVQAAWLRIPVIREWTANLFASPFGQMFLRQNPGPYGRILLGANDLTSNLDPTLKVSSPSCYTHETEGVYMEYRVEWGTWTGYLRRDVPNGWVVENDNNRQFKKWLRLPATVYKNGKEDMAFLGNNGESEEKKHIALSLPATPAPVDVTGGFAAFFATEEEVVNFCLRHNVIAEKIWLGLHAPADYSNEPGAHLLTLNEEWAKIAWAEGAKPLPETIGEIPPTEQWEYKASSNGNSYWDRSYIPVGAVKGYCFGQAKDGINVSMSEGGGNCEKYHRGWVRVANDRKVVLSHGLTIRDVGDSMRDRTETVVYTDGRLVLAEN